MSPPMALESFQSYFTTSHGERLPIIDHRQWIAGCLTHQVLRQSKDGRLSNAGSCVFYPNDPAKYSLCSTFRDPNAPVVYVEAPHVYHGRRGIPTQPPCPKHGWEAVENGQASGSWRTLTRPSCTGSRRIG